MKFFISSLLFLNISFLSASESGYLYMGKAHILYKEGISNKNLLNEKRSPATFKENTDLSPEIIRYEVDSKNGVVCYWRDKASANTPITCLKK